MLIDTGIVRREGGCPLQYALIREILEYFHDDFRFTLTRLGLSDGNEIMPVKLSIHAILLSRSMDYYKVVLLGETFREKTWPIVKSNSIYNDIESWLKANKFPYVYDDETVKTANEYGIYRYTNDPHYAFYDGDWLDGKKHGQGKLVWKNGTIFVGDMQNNYYGKRGISTYNGAVYVGEFKKLFEHGQGKLTASDGSVYDGGWKTGNKHGYGTLINADGTIIEGTWRDGTSSDHHKKTWPDGRIYIGEWKGKLRHGLGKQTWNDGRTYIGEWEDDKMHGMGKYTYSDGHIIEGDFINNIFQLIIS